MASAFMLAHGAIGFAALVGVLFPLFVFVALCMELGIKAIPAKWTLASTFYMLMMAWFIFASSSTLRSLVPGIGDRLAGIGSMPILLSGVLGIPIGVAMFWQVTKSGESPPRK